MAKHKPTPQAVRKPQQIEAFTFGEPSAVMDRRDILDYVECIHNGKWYEPPVNFSGLAKSLRAAVHHSSPIYVKRNILASTYIPHPLLSRQDFSRLVLDYLVFGNAFLEKRMSLTGQLMKLETSPAKYTRRGVEDGVYWYVSNHAQPHEFAPGSVFHLLEPDINQELYGMPEYLSALNSAWLNESATLFRRKYYQNGAHAGYIMYVTDAAQSSTDVESLRDAMRNSKGLGNFKNLFFYAPNGKPDGIKIVPLSEVATKDDFFNIKKVSAEDLMSAHRVPPQMMGIMPNNSGGFGDVVKASKVFVRNELCALQERIKEINQWAGIDIVEFTKYSF
ncbi:TPA: phage portal protein [Enterobacter hormaechei subsp. xiangfangensis]|nr:phage portal protein [Enterobacter hormaechei subsp. xiangfangensis]